MGIHASHVVNSKEFGLKFEERESEMVLKICEFGSENVCREKNICLSAQADSVHIFCIPQVERE